MRLSILSISNHPGGLDVFEDDFARQTIWKKVRHDLEWLYVDELKSKARTTAFQETCERLGISHSTHVYPADYHPPRFTKLNRAWNTGLNLATGDFILFADDYIWWPDDLLERMLAACARVDYPLLTTPRCDRVKYPPRVWCRTDTDTAYSIFQKPFPQGVLPFPHVSPFWEDTRTEPYSINPHYWEPMVGLAPRQLLLDAGGYDEELDHGYASGHADIANRVMKTEPRTRIHFMRDVYCQNIDQREYWDDPEGLQEAVERNQRVVTLRIPPEVFGVERVVGKETLKVPSGLEILDGIVQKTVTIPKKEVDRIVRDAVTEARHGLSICFWMPDIGNWLPINPESPFDHALGGRETACIRLAQELAALGCRVTIVTKVTKNWIGDVSWHPPETITPKVMATYDVVVSLERADIFNKVRARLNILHFQCTYSLVEIDQRLDSRIDHYFLLSKYQQFTLRSQFETIHPDKCVVFGNGVDLARYDDLDVPTIPGRMVWSSSPDRGLHHLLRFWPRLKAALPDLSLRVFYDIEKSLGPKKWLMQLEAEWYRECQEGILQEGVEYLGPIDQMTLAREQKKAELFVYPCDPQQPTETFCQPPGSLVFTQNGMKAIETIEPGELVLTHRGRFQPVTRRLAKNHQGELLGFHRKKDAETTWVTPDHELFVSTFHKRRDCTKSNLVYNTANHRTQWKAASTVTERREFLTSTATIPGTRETVRITDYVPDLESDGTWVSARLRMARYHRVPNLIHLTPEFAWTCGLLAAEGNVSKGRTGKTGRPWYSAIIVSGHRKETQYRQERLALSFPGIPQRVERQGLTNAENVVLQCSPYARFFAAVIGVGREKRVPPFIWDAPFDVQQAFLEGALYGDGSVFHTERVSRKGASPTHSYTSISPSLAYGIAQLLLNRGEFPSMRYEAKRRAYELNWYPEGKSPSHWINEGYAATRIAERHTAEYEGPVYDLEVEEDHSYICGRTIVHNCITALENATARVPMILSTADCLQEIYGGKRDCAWFLDVPILDEQWIQTIIELRNEPEQLRKTVPAARALTEQFTWKKIASRWYGFLQKRIILDGKPDQINDLVDETERALAFEGEPTPV